MIEIRKSNERGIANLGWLDSRHTFSFGHYHDPRHMGFGPLLVINEDRVLPGKGFGKHGHRDMEIISYVLSGELAHQDSMGNGSVLRYGDVQRMSAGTGVMHSEFNHSSTDLVHFLQIWIQPSVTGITPGYEEKHFANQAKTARLCLIASPDGAEGSVKIHQDARLYASLLDGEQQIEHTLAQGRTAYLHLIRGELEANGVKISTGDALKFSSEPGISISKGREAEFLLFDLPY